MVQQSCTAIQMRFSVECISFQQLTKVFINMRINRLMALGFIISTVFSVPVLQADMMPGKVASAEEAAAVYANRADFMKGLGSSMKAFSNYLKRGDGEPLELSGMAAEIAERASEIPGLFPQDTGMAQNEDSEAMAEIWEQWAEFVAAADALVAPAEAVEAAFDSGDKKKIGQAVKALGRNGCHGCHIQFRHEHE